MRIRAGVWRALLIVLPAALAPVPATAQTWEVGWWTVDGGGVTFGSGGPFTVGATLGQPDAGGPLAGSPFVVHGGFWALAPRPDLSVTKTDGQASAVPGQVVAYTIVASNAGPGAATGALVTDTPPASLVGVTWTCAASPGSSCPASGSGPIAETVDLLAGGTATFVLTATVDPAAVGTLVNTASVAAPPGTIDPNAANNAASDADSLTPLADLALALSDAPDPAIPGTGLTYTIQVTSLGPSVSPGASVTHVLPGQASFVSSTPGAPTCVHAGGVVTCALGSLGPAASATITVQVDVSPAATGVLSSTASVAGAVADPVAANNSDTEATNLVPQADLALALDDSPDPVVPGSPLTYTLQVTSGGPSVSPGMTVTHTLPADVSFVSSTPGAPVCVHAGGVVTCTLGSLDPAGSAIVTVQGTVSPSATGTLSSSATVVGGALDPVAANNTDVEATALTLTADLSISKSDGQASAVPGQAVTYTIVAANAGPSAATGAAVTDAPPPTLLDVTWTCTASAGSSCPASGSGTIDASVDLLANGSATFTLTGTVSPSAAVSLVNTAAAAAPTGVADPDPLNDTATDTDTLTPVADLGVSLSDSPDPVRQEHALTYTLTVTNSGPSSSAAPTLVQALPPEVAFVSSTPGSPICVPAAGAVSCSLTALDPGASATVTVVATVATNVLGTITSDASVTGGDPDPVSANDTDSEATNVLMAVDGELIHGSRLVADLRALPGATADEDRFRLAQLPHSSYEVVLDGASGDLGSGSGPGLDRVASDGFTVLQSSEPIGTGRSRSLRWETGDVAVLDQMARVRSLGCGPDCGPEDVYRLRVYETTYSVSRFNSSGTQATALLLQNTGESTVAGHVYFTSGAGALLETVAFSLAPHALRVINTASLPALFGQAGTIRVSHDGRYGQLAGKAVALEPSTAFTFDTPMEPRPR